jgi:hypothetical protein
MRLYLYSIEETNMANDNMTITLSIPQTWKNAAWYDGKQIDLAWIQEKIEMGLEYMEEICGIALDQSESEFQTRITAFRERRAKAEQIAKERWSDPVYRKNQYDMITQDDLPRIQELFKNCGR